MAQFSVHIAHFRFSVRFELNSAARENDRFRHALDHGHQIIVAAGLGHLNRRLPDLIARILKNIRTGEPIPAQRFNGFIHFDGEGQLGSGQTLDRVRGPALLACRQDRVGRWCHRNGRLDDSGGANDRDLHAAGIGATHEDSERKTTPYPLKRVLVQVRLTDNRSHLDDHTFRALALQDADPLLVADSRIYHQIPAFHICAYIERDIQLVVFGKCQILCRTHDQRGCGRGWCI